MNHKLFLIICISIIPLSKISAQKIVIEDDDFVFTVVIDGEPFGSEILEITDKDTIVCPFRYIVDSQTGSHLIKRTTTQSVSGPLYYHAKYNYVIGKSLYTVDILIPIPLSKEEGKNSTWVCMIDFCQFSDRTQKINLKKFNSLRYYLYQKKSGYISHKKGLAKVVSVVDVEAVNPAHLNRRKTVRR